MSTLPVKLAPDEQFDKIWRGALAEYKDKTGHDLKRFQGDKTINELSVMMTDEDNYFDEKRKGSENMQKTRDVLKACIKPVEALSAVASSALSLTPFAPAATVFGAGMYLIRKSLRVFSLRPAYLESVVCKRVTKTDPSTGSCENITTALDCVSKILDHCKEFVSRLQIYLRTKITPDFLKTITHVTRFMLESFAECETLLVDEKRDKIKRFRTFLGTALLGKRPDELLKASEERLEKSFGREERDSIAQIYVDSQAIAAGVKSLVSSAERDRIQSVIESLPIGPYNVLVKQAAENNKSLYSPPDWILQDKDFLRWWEGAEESARWLWGLGSTGAGKTSLVSFLTSRWQAQCKLHEDSDVAEHTHSGKLGGPPASEKHIAVAFYYGDYKIKDEQRPEYVFKSLIRQLLVQLRSINAKLVDKACDQIATLNGATNDSADNLSELSWTKILDTIMAGFDQTFIVIDALDDQEEGYRDLILGLAGLSASGLKLFVTSRNMRSLRADAGNQDAIILDIRAKDEHIEAYIRKRLSRIHSRREDFASGEWIKGSALPDLLDDEAQWDRIVQIILGNAKSNYYRAEVQITTIKAAQSRDGIEQKLIALSKNLGEAIQLDIEMIDAQTDLYKQRVGTQALMLATHAERPLSVAEMRHALVLLLHPETRYDVAEHRKRVNAVDGEFLLDSSCGILEIDDKEGKVLLDEAIKDHCRETKVFPSAHYDLATICLTYLDHRFFSMRINSRQQHAARKEQFPFFGYAGRYWGVHVREAGETRFLKPSAPVSLASLLGRKLFLDIAAVSLHHDLQTLRMWDWAGHDSWRELTDLPRADYLTQVNGKPVRHTAQPILWPLHLLIFFNLPHLTDWWLQQHPDEVNRRSSTGTTPLYLACSMGRVRIAELLLFNHHADPGLKGAEPSGFNLAAAVLAQSYDIVERLLYFRRKDLLEQTNWHGREPLGEAMRQGNADIIKILVDASVALDRDRLLKHGERDGWTALHEAATVAHNSMAIRFVLEAPHGKELLQRQTLQWKDSALHLAAIRGHTDVVHTLLEYGADPAARQSLGKTPLMLAVEGLFAANEQVIRTLIQWSISHDLKHYDLVDNGGLTTWHLAAHHGRNRNVELLIALTPVPLFNKKSKDGRTPIRCAANAILEGKSGGHVFCINVFLRDQEGMVSSEDALVVFDALMAEKEHPEIASQALERLLQHKVDPWPMLPGNTTMLHRTIRDSVLDAVKVVWRSQGSKDLLEYRDENGITPLLLAAKMSRPKVALFLLDIGTDPSVQDNSGRTALHYAVERDTPDLVRQILTKNIDHHRKDKYGVEAIDRASAKNSCLKLWQVRNLRRIHDEHTEHECVSSRRATSLHIVSGPVMRDQQLGKGVEPGMIAFKHAEYLRSEPVPPQAKFPVSRIELSVAWSVFENNKDDDAVISIAMLKDGVEHISYPIFNSGEEPDRAVRGGTRRAVWHLAADIVNELRPHASEQNQHKARDFVRMLGVGDELVLKVDAKGVGRIAFVTEAEIKVVYEA